MNASYVMLNRTSICIRNNVRSNAIIVNIWIIQLWNVNPAIRTVQSALDLTVMNVLLVGMAWLSITRLTHVIVKMECTLILIINVPYVMIRRDVSNAQPRINVFNVEKVIN